VAGYLLTNFSQSSLGSILEGPDPTELLKPLVEQALPLLLELMRDPVLSVKDTTSWTLGRICDVVPEPLKTPDTLHVVISAIINGLAESPRVASNCCWVGFGSPSVARSLINLLGA